MKYDKIVPSDSLPISSLSYASTPSGAGISDAACLRADSARAEVTLLCDVRQGMRPWTRVRLDDISRSGFRIVWFPAVDVNRPLRIKIPAMQLLSATIRWRSANALGCAFDEPLHVAVFEHIVRTANGQLR